MWFLVFFLLVVVFFQYRENRSLRRPVIPIRIETKKSGGKFLANLVGERRKYEGEDRLQAIGRLVCAQEQTLGVAVGIEWQEYQRPAVVHRRNEVTWSKS